MQKNSKESSHFWGARICSFTNNATERDLRPLCLHRKATGGTRSVEDSATLTHWMTVTQTLRKQGLELGGCSGRSRRCRA